MKQITKVVLISFLILFLSGVMLAHHVSANGSETDKTQQIDKKKQKQLFKGAEKFVKEDNYTKAIAKYEDLMKEYPNTEIEKNAQYRIAGLYHSSAQMKNVKIDEKKRLHIKSIEKYNEYIKKYPKDEKVVNAHRRIMAIYSEDGKYEEAIEKARMIIKQYPNNNLAAFAQSQLFEFYLNLQDFDKALDEGEKLIKNYPNERSYVKSMKINMPFVWASKGNYERAISDLNKLILEYPNDDDIISLAEEEIERFKEIMQSNYK